MTLLPLSFGDGLDLVRLCLGGQLHCRHEFLLLAPDLLLFNLDLLPALDHLKSDSDRGFSLCEKDRQKFAFPFFGGFCEKELQKFIMEENVRETISLRSEKKEGRQNKS